MNQKQKRKSDSCRFDPYYKMEWFDHNMFVWRPMQKSFNSIEQAKAAQSKHKTWRIFEVSESGRRILE